MNQEARQAHYKICVPDIVVSSAQEDEKTLLSSAEQFSFTLRYTAIGPRLRRALVFINAVLAVAGVAIIILAVHIQTHENDYDIGRPYEASAWWLGIIPVATGLFGTVCFIFANRILVSCWIVATSFLHIAGFMMVILTDCLIPGKYHITLQIYGDCAQEEMTCSCQWADGSRVASTSHASCDVIRQNTTLLLSVICVIITCLTLILIAVMLAITAVCYLNRCIREPFRSRSDSCRSISPSRTNYQSYSSECSQANYS